MNLFVVVQQIQTVVQVLNNVEVKGKVNLTNQAACIEILEQLHMQIAKELELSQAQQTPEHAQINTSEE